jgi:hypothetical protein
MYRHPSMTAALAEQHRRDLINRAESYRLARAARTSRAAPARHAPRPTVITQLPPWWHAPPRGHSRHRRCAMTASPARGAPAAS